MTTLAEEYLSKYEPLLLYRIPKMMSYSSPDILSPWLPEGFDARVRELPDPQDILFIFSTGLLPNKVLDLFKTRKIFFVFVDNSTIELKEYIVNGRKGKRSVHQDLSHVNGTCETTATMVTGILYDRDVPSYIKDTLKYTVDSFPELRAAVTSSILEEARCMR